MLNKSTLAALGIYSTCVCIFCLLPVFAIVGESVTATNFIVFPPQGFSLKWYSAILDRPEFISSAWVSLAVACIASLVATALGTLCAIALVRYDFFGRSLLQTLFMAPLSLPGLIFGLALLQFFSAHNLPRDMTTLMVGHVIITMPFAIRFVTVSLTAMNGSLELAANSLGANWFTTFRLVTFPLIRAGIVASLVFTFILSFDDVSVSLFLSSTSSTTLPVRIYSYIDQNYDPLVTAVSALIVFAAFAALALVERVMGVGKLFGLH